MGEFASKDEKDAASKMVNLEKPINLELSQMLHCTTFIIRASLRNSKDLPPLPSQKAGLPRASHHFLEDCDRTKLQYRANVQGLHWKRQHDGLLGRTELLRVPLCPRDIILLELHLQTEV